MKRRSTNQRPNFRLRQFLAGWFAGFTLLLLVAGGITVVFCLQFLPVPTSLFRPMPEGAVYLDRHGTPLRNALNNQGQFSELASEQSLPPNLVHATLAAEDSRFFNHCGVDFLAIARAAKQAITHRRIVSGASTITQQLIKLASPPRRRGDWGRKALEAAQACRLETLWSKEQILTAYVNRLNYGNLHQGIHTASEYYFAKSPETLSIAEAAFLAGIPQSPTRLNPRRNFKAAKSRQEWILSRMQRLGWITQPEYDTAMAEPIRLAKPPSPFEAPHFVDWVRGKPSTPWTGRITTTLDLPLQQVCEKVLKQNLTRLAEHHARDGAVVVLDNRTGHVLSMVGSDNFLDPADGKVNGVDALRSPGSALKPFTYLLALERGQSPGSILADTPVTYQTATGLFTPRNYSHAFHGPIRLREALANSLNIPAVKTLETIGGPGVLVEGLEQLGFRTLPETPEHYGLGLTLGNAEVTLIDMAHAYATLARLGQPLPLQHLLDAKSARTFYGAAASALSPTNTPARQRACWLIADILSDNAARALEFGWDSALRFDFPVACKTGTSTGYRDNWAVGFTPEFTVAVWIGNFDGTPMQSVTGVSGAAPVLHDIFEYLHRQFGTTWYTPRQDLVRVLLHRHSGKQLTPERAQALGALAVTDWCVRGQEPPWESPSDYEPSGRLKLGQEFSEWYRSQGEPVATLYALDNTPANAALQILKPLEGTEYFYDRDLPANAQRILLQSNHACEWISDSLHCWADGTNTYAQLAPGRHRLVARDRRNRSETARWIEVKPL